ALGRLLRRAQPRPVQGYGAAALGGELGWAGTAHARQLRRFRRRGLEAEMAGGSRRLALGAVLYRLRREAAEAVLRSFPQRRGQRLGQAAAGAAAGAAPRREVRAAPRERVAARAHAMDALPPRPEGSRALREARGGRIAGVRRDGRGRDLL